MSDYLVRIITDTGNVRALACVTTDLVREGASRHGTLPTAGAALGRALTGGALFGALLKTGQRVALKFEGNGPLGKIIVEAESNGAVRGLVGEPRVDLADAEGHLDVAGALGRAGFLTVTKDLGLKEPYRSTVQLYTSGIAEDLAWYLTESEQVPSAVGLGVATGEDGTVASAGGFLIQSLPPQDDATIDLLMKRIAALPPLADFFRSGKTPEELLALLFEGIPCKTLEKRALAFVCSCSRARIERVLISLGKEELADIFARQGEAEVGCEFCGEHYRFDREELERLLAGMTASSAD
ncbi:MAG TPA: Hsp33 family molecular chaperone HslO [Geobacteraceae bacterium]